MSWKYGFGACAIGFNLFPRHIPNAANSLVKDPGVKKVLLLRENKIKCYVSRAIARKTGVWDTWNSDKHPSKRVKMDVRVKIHPNQLLHWSKCYDNYFKKMREKLDKTGQNFFELTYEDLVGHKGDVVKTNILSFIGVNNDASYLVPPIKKQNSKTLRELIENFDDLEYQLRGTSLLDCLYH
jgi:LPS sulfotransferase NodH